MPEVFPVSVFTFDAFGDSPEPIVTKRIGRDRPRIAARHDHARGLCPLHPASAMPAASASYGPARHAQSVTPIAPRPSHASCVGLTQPGATRSRRHVRRGLPWVLHRSSARPTYFVFISPMRFSTISASPSALRIVSSTACKLRGSRMSLTIFAGRPAHSTGMTTIVVLGPV